MAHGNGRRYQKAPLVEALFELVFAESAPDPLLPGRLYEGLKHALPVAEARTHCDATFAVASTGQASVQARSPRAVFRSPGGGQRVQVGQDILIVNQLAPYPGFTAWRTVVEMVLGVLRETAPQVRFARLGLRYINRISTPAHVTRLEQLFELYPRLPPALGSHGAYLVQLEVPRLPHMVIASLGSAPAEPGAAGHLLDLYDLLQPSEPLDTVAALSVLDAAHEHVEDVFEATITDTLRQIFEPEG